VIREKVDSDGGTQGANLSLDVNLAGNIQGELGFGYDFIKDSPLIGAGLYGPYINLGTDLFTTDSSLVPFAIIHT
jgi:hypothetical protein